MFPSHTLGSSFSLRAKESVTSEACDSFYMILNCNFLLATLITCIIVIDFFEIRLNPFTLFPDKRIKHDTVLDQHPVNDWTGIHEGGRPVVSGDILCFLNKIILMCMGTVEVSST